MKQNVQTVVVVVLSECAGGGDGGGGFTSHTLKHILFGSYERPNYPTSPLVSLTPQPNYYRTVVI